MLGKLFYLLGFEEFTVKSQSTKHLLWYALEPSATAFMSVTSVIHAWYYSYV